MSHPFKDIFQSAGPVRTGEPDYHVARRGPDGELIIETKTPTKQLTSRSKLTPAEERAQTAMMMAERLVKNKTYRQIASEFGLERKTVEKRIHKAEREGLDQNIHDVFVEEMLPSALAVVKQSLDSDDEKIRVQVAFKVIDGLGVMKQKDDSNNGQETLEVFRARLVRNSKSDDRDDEFGPDDDYIDGEASAPTRNVRPSDESVESISVQNSRLEGHSPASGSPQARPSRRALDPREQVGVSSEPGGDE
jgi:predicted transcriptional regulator